MKWLTALVSIVIVIGWLSANAQVSASVENAPSRFSPTLLAARQKTLDSGLHQRVVTAGGKLVETRDAKTTDLSGDLASLMNRSDAVVLAHVVTSYGGLSPSGDRVQSHYDVQVLQSWKGSHKTGDVVTFFVPAGSLPFGDGTQAIRNVKGFSRLHYGGRYVLFLRSAVEDGQSTSNFWLVGDGVQGAFQLAEEKVEPIYRQGSLWKTCNQQAVPAFLADLDANAASLSQTNSSR